MASAGWSRWSSQCRVPCPHPTRSVELSCHPGPEDTCENGVFGLYLRIQTVMRVDPALRGGLSPCRSFLPAGPSPPAHRTTWAQETPTGTSGLPFIPDAEGSPPFPITWRGHTPSRARQGLVGGRQEWLVLVIDTAPTSKRQERGPNVPRSPPIEAREGVTEGRVWPQDGEKAAGPRDHPEQGALARRVSLGARCTLQVGRKAVFGGRTWWALGARLSRRHSHGL